MARSLYVTHLQGFMVVVFIRSSPIQIVDGGEKCELGKNHALVGGQLTLSTPNKIHHSCMTNPINGVSAF